MLPSHSLAAQIFCPAAAQLEVATSYPHPRAGLLCLLTFLQLAAAQNVTVCWGKGRERTSMLASRFTSSACRTNAGCAFVQTKSPAVTVGSGSDGQLGHGMVADSGSYSSKVPVVVAGNHSFASVCTGQSHTCALDATGKAWCFGAFRLKALHAGLQMFACLDLTYSCIPCMQALEAMARWELALTTACRCQWKLWVTKPSAPSLVATCIRARWMAKATHGVGVSKTARQPPCATTAFEHCS